MGAAHQAGGNIQGEDPTQLATSHNHPRGLQITTLGTVTPGLWSGANLHYDYCRIR